jgi:glucose/arabinose dehydrogenase
MRIPARPATLRVALAGLIATPLLLVVSTPSPAGAADVYTATQITAGLANAAAFTFAPDGRIFIAERLTGKIKVWNPAKQKSHLFVTVPRIVGDVNNELGLDGIVLHPSFPAKPFIYAYATRNVDGTPRIQIVRYRTSKAGGKGTGVHPNVIYQSATTAGPQHVGGRMQFGPRGMLYVVIGDAGTSSNAQDLAIERGKLLRMTPKGVPAPGNPFGTRVYSYGHRNSFGFDFDPQTGNIWETENGPECNDEINRIVPGGNYAWGPNETCSNPPAAPVNTNQDGPTPRIQPLVFYDHTIGPTGAVFCDGCGLNPAAEGALFFGAFNTGKVTRVTLTGNRLGVASTTVVLTHLPRVLSMEASPTGRIFFSDGKGIFRLDP